MKNLGGKPVVISSRLIFCLILSLIYSFTVPGGETCAGEMNCDKYIKLFGLSFATHRLTFSRERIRSIFKQSLALTIKDLDPNGDIFDSTEVLELSSNTGEEDFKRCTNLANIYEIYNSRASSTVSLASVFESAMKNLLGRMDPHSKFYNSRQWETFSKLFKAKRRGTGLVLEIIEGNFPTVLRIIKGSPTENVLLPGDIIIEINGIRANILSPNEILSILGQGHNNAILMQVKRHNKILTFEIESQDYVPSNVDWQYLDDQQRLVHLKVDRFSQDTSNEILKALSDASEISPISGLIIDLRYNSGGLVSEAVNMASMFIDEPKLATIVQKHRQIEIVPRVTIPRSLEPREISIILLVNNFTASASETFALLIKDFKRGPILGLTTFGKGTGQTLFPPELLSKELNEDYEVGMKVTTVEIHSIFGGTAQLYGISPDITVHDPNLEQKIAIEKEIAKAKGKKFYIRESDFDNPLPPIKIDGPADLSVNPTNDIPEIVKLVGEQARLAGTEFPRITLEKDVQLNEAYKFMRAYTRLCSNFHVRSCSFGGEAYASK